MKKTFIIIGIILGVLVAVLAAAPYIVYKNQDKIIDVIIHDLNESFGFELKIEKFYVSPFKNFPYISIDLNNISLSDPNEEDILKRTILEFEDVYVGFDVIELLKGNYDVKKLYFKNGKLNYHRDLEGKTNIDFLLTESDEEKEATQLDFHLQEVVLEKVLVIYEDFLKNQYYEVKVDDLTTGLDYDENKIRNHIESDFYLNVMQIDGVNYFRNKHFEITSDLTYLVKEKFIKVKPSFITVENGVFKASGNVDLANDNYFDLKLEGKKSDFDLLIAFTSEDIQNFMKSYKNEGDVYFIGSVKGNSNSKSTPQIDFEFGCENAFFRNPETERSIEELNFKGYFSNGEKQSLETTSILIENLSGVPEKSVFRGSFGVQNFLEPKVFLDFHTKLYLDAVYDLYPFEFIESMTGYLAIDLTLDEFVYIDSMDVSDKFSKIKKGADSKIIMKNISMKLADYDIPLEKVNANITVDDGIINIRNFAANILDNNTLASESRIFKKP